MFNNNLPPGDYYVGDPCYVIDPWDEWLEVFLDHTDDYGVIANFRGEPCFVAYTKHGDGAYRGDPSGFFLVDSGTIACIPLEILTEVDEAGGEIWTFESEFEASRDDEGTFHLDDLKIYTGYGTDDDY